MSKRCFPAALLRALWHGLLAVPPPRPQVSLHLMLSLGQFPICNPAHGAPPIHADAAIHYLTYSIVD
jgi:hypothetical protein